MRFQPWKCPACGEAAKGSLELIEGIAGLSFDDRGDAEYTGVTDVLWDTQTAIDPEPGVVTLVCSNGHDWKARAR